MTATPGRVAAGANGAGPLRRLYRRSPLRRLLRVELPGRGLHPDDVFVASYPRSGNAWLAFMLLELCGRDATFDMVRFEVPIVGAHANAPAHVPGGGRFIKTHEPYMRVYRRALHLVRDPRDVALSYFRFMQREGELVLTPNDDVAATFDRYLDAFIAGRLSPHGTWQTHLDSWLAAQRDRPNDVVRLRYEDMRADTPAAVRQIADWTGFKISDDRAAVVAQRCSLDRMRADEKQWRGKAEVFGSPRTEIAYVGPASLGGWRDTLTDEQQRRFRIWSKGIAAMGYEAPI